MPRETKIGLLLYAIYTLINRFIFRIPNMIGIPIMIVGMVFIFIGIVKAPRRPH